MRKSLIIALGTALAGCSLMPDYQRPELPVAAQWPQTAQPDGLRKATELDWRNFFPDQRLQALIAAALEHNRDMRIAAARVEEARSLHDITRADRWPSVDAAAGGQLARTPGDLSSTGKAVTSRRYDIGLSLLSFELDFWGRVKSLDEAALASFLATEEARRALRLSLISEVANAYFTLLEMEERTRLAHETVNSREETRTMISRRREVGLAGDLDFLQADGALELVRAELASLQRQQATAANALVLLVGQQPSSLPEGRALPDQAIVADLAADLPAEVLLQRPDVVAAEKRLMAANANIGAARAAFLPRISLTAGLGTASSALSGLFAGGSESWIFQPALRLPLFGGGAAGCWGGPAPPPGWISPRHAKSSPWPSTRRRSSKPSAKWPTSSPPTPIWSSNCARSRLRKRPRASACAWRKPATKQASPATSKCWMRSANPLPPSKPRCRPGAHGSPLPLSFTRRWAAVGVEPEKD
jgi:multidrug efflux system outer membrane protein